MQIDLTQNFGQYLNPQARNIEEYEVFLTVGPCLACSPTSSAIGASLRHILKSRIRNCLESDPKL